MDLFLAQGDARDVLDVVFDEELAERKVEGGGDLLEGLERGNGVAVFNAGEVATQQAGALLDITLRHAALEAEVADGHPNIDRCGVRGDARRGRQSCVHICH